MKKTIGIHEAARLRSVTDQDMRIMIQTQVMPAWVAVYVRKPKARKGHYIIWKDAFYNFYHLGEAQDA